MDLPTEVVAAIISLAFQEFVKSGSGELAKKFTVEAISKMALLSELIGKRLKVNPDAETILNNVQAGSEEEIPDLIVYLKAAMRNDQYFADQIQAIAQEINAGKLLDQSSMIQNNYGNAKGWQTKVEGGTAYIGEIYINDRNK
jgi:hypothetical protein